MEHRIHEINNNNSNNNTNQKNTWVILIQKNKDSYYDSWQ